MPGPYTVILERHPTLARQIKDKRREVGLRIPREPLIRAVIEALGKPLAASTLPIHEPGVGLDDRFGSDHPKFGSQVMDIWGHAIEMVVDLGDESIGQETTIIDLTEGVPRLVRLGAGDPAVFGL